MLGSAILFAACERPPAEVREIPADPAEEEARPLPPPEPPSAPGHAEDRPPPVPPPAPGVVAAPTRPPTAPGPDSETLSPLEEAARRCREEGTGPSESAEPGPGEVARCDPLFGWVLGTVWSTWSDARPLRPECEVGTSVSHVELLSDGRDGQGCRVRWTGEVTPVHPRPHAGISLDMRLQDLSGYERLVLRVRGDGKRYRAELPLCGQLYEAVRGDCQNGHWDFYGVDFRCGDGSERWQEVVLDFAELRTEGWGWNALKRTGWPRPWPFDPGEVVGFSIRTQENGPFRCDLSAWRLE